MRVEYKSTALRDLQNLNDYISKELKNRTAAKKLIAALLKAGSLLAENPYMGAALQERFEIETDIRYLVVKRHLIFYQVTDSTVSIIRIIDGRRDYMALLFG